MARYRRYKPRRRLFRMLWLAAALLVVVLAGAGLWVRHAYITGLAPVSSDPKTQIFTVTSGSSVRKIAGDLQSQHLIRSAWAMEWYTHGKNVSGALQAGSYAFAPDQGTQAIVSILSKGRVSTQLVTILPGRRIDQVRADLINDGFAPGDVDQALQPGLYADLPVVSLLPAGTGTLEGLLWPDSFQKDASTPASHIIRESLVEMQQHLTPDVTAAIHAEGLSTYQGLTLASIIIQEVGKSADQTQAAQVFLTRLQRGMMLGSDPTAKYGAVIAGHAPDLTYDSPYNTLLHSGLPPTPISTINSSSLAAVAHPANTNWLYFVAGDDGTTYFSTNLQDHQALTQKYCHKLCSP